MFPINIIFFKKLSIIFRYVFSWPYRLLGTRQKIFPIFLLHCSFFGDLPSGEHPLPAELDIWKYFKKSRSIRIKRKMERIVTL